MWKTYVEISYQEKNGNMTFIDETVPTHVQHEAVKYVYDKYNITNNMSNFEKFETVAQLIHVGEEE